MLYINIIAMLQTFLFATLLYKKSSSNMFNTLLSVLLLVLGVILLGNTVVLFEGISPVAGVLFFFTQAGSLFVGPIIYCYLSLLSGKKIKILNYFFVATFLGLVYVFYLALQFLLLSPEGKLSYIEQLNSLNYPKGMYLFSWLYVGLQQVYFTVSWIRINKFSESIKNIFSTRSRTRNVFAYKFITLIFILDVLLIVAMLMIPMYQIQFVVFPIKIVIAFSIIIYYMFDQNPIFDNKSYLEYRTDIELLKKANLDGFTDFDNEQINPESIRNILIEKKLFLNPSLTIFDLAKELGCNPRVLSTAINQKLNTTFLSLINELRVKQAKKILENNPENLTMEGVGLESGFNSRSSFYRVFKKITKQTPIQYMSNN
ncbi:helix-turn-helix domain-containing protein [Bacteroidota bacterium]